MDAILRTIEKFIPVSIYEAAQPYYHKFLSVAGALRYWFPARKLRVIMVTGTKGKSSTTEMINSIFEAAGHVTALSNTIRFKIGAESRPNKYKMTMPGRFFVQRFLSDAIKAGCDTAILEVSSQAATQYRHKFLYPDAFVFLHITPEHIESHGGWEQYVQAKLDIGKELERSPKRPTVLVVNRHSQEVDRFLALDATVKETFGIEDGEPWRDHDRGILLTWRGVKIHSRLRGSFNIENALAAATLSKAMGISEENIKIGIEKLENIHGRAELIDEGQVFNVVVDYAHTVESLERVYDAFRHTKRVCILGNTGGGRDTWKRPKMAGVADQHCDEIILTNEDPYDEDPQAIVNDMKRAITKAPVTIEMDRRSAIALGIRKAAELQHQEGSIGASLLITGKGTDPYIMGKNGTKEKWSDAEVAREELRKFLAKKS